ncbi:MAG TPA: hypothetical protein VNL17_05295 [Verrucomicrobiae bacterium]|nr:hypothetical protein [Verrucomicrobiae bacterium]
MKRVIRHAITVAAVSALLALPSANARMGGGGAPMQQGSPGQWGNHWGGGFRGGNRFDHDRFHDRSSFFFFGAFPFWYPYYWPPYYYYDYPPYYYYDGYYDYAPGYYYYDYGPPASYYTDRSTGYPPTDGRSYLMLGHDAGKALRKKAVSWDWFVEYLQAYIINAPSWVRDEFQRGFVSGYGDDAESMYKKGFQQAQQPKVSRNESAPSPEPNSNPQRY